MSIASTTRKAGPFTGNGLTTIFPFTFKVFQASDLLVVRTDLSGIETTLTLTTDYTVALNANQDSNPGGTITAVSAPASGFLLTMTSNVPELQPVVLTNMGGFYPRVINDALDRLTIFTQQISEKLGRALTLPLSTPSGVSTQLPFPAANKIIAWNQNANGLQSMDPSELATVVAFGTAKADIFSGTGSQTAFTLTASPGALNNLDVSISGVTQKPGLDYTWSSGTTITFTSAPPVGTNNVLARYLQGLPQGSSDSASATFIQAGTGAVTRTAQDKMREWVSVKDFGAKGDGIADDTGAIQAAINSAVLTGKRRVYVPVGIYNISSAIALSQFKGLELFGECNPSGYSINSCSYLRYTAASGSLISIDSAHGVKISNLFLGYNNAAYTGDLVKTNNSASFDVTNCEFYQCVFSGESASFMGAASLLRLEKTIICSVVECWFSLAQKGIVIFAYCNIVEFRRNTFIGLVLNSVYQQTGTNESLAFYNNTFEPLISGRASAFSSAASQYSNSFVYQGNWHGDVSVGGGNYWLQGNFRQALIAGNMFGSAGAGASDYAISSADSIGLSIVNNMFLGKALSFTAPNYSVVISNNSFQSGDTINGLANLNNYTVLSNYNLAGLARSKAYRVANQAIPNATPTAIAFDGNYWDQGGVHSTSVNNTRFTVPAGQSGMWRIEACVLLNTAISGKAYARVYKNGVFVFGNGQAILSASIQQYVNVQASDVAVAGDYFEVYITQDSGASLNVIGSAFTASDTHAVAYRLMTGD
jgi:hypothetical protein